MEGSGSSDQGAEPQVGGRARQGPAPCASAPCGEVVGLRQAPPGQGSPLLKPHCDALQLFLRDFVNVRAAPREVQ